MPVNVLFLHEFFFKFHALIAIFFLGGFPNLYTYLGIKKGLAVSTNPQGYALFTFIKLFDA